jgi:hypothetical protein
VEENSVPLVSNGGWAGAELFDRGVVLTVGVGGVAHATAVVRGVEADRRRTRDVLAGETERLVANLASLTLARPADVEADVRWNRRWASAQDRIEEVVVVGDGDVAGVQPRPAAPGVDVDRRGCNRDRPEQP